MEYTLRKTKISYITALLLALVFSGCVFYGETSNRSAFTPAIITSTEVGSFLDYGIVKKSWTDTIRTTITTRHEDGTATGAVIGGLAGADGGGTLGDVVAGAVIGGIIGSLVTTPTQRVEEEQVIVYRVQMSGGTTRLFSISFNQNAELFSKGDSITISQMNGVHYLSPARFEKH